MRRSVTTGDSVTSRHDPCIMRSTRTLAVAQYLLYSYSLSMDMKLWMVNQRNSVSSQLLTQSIFRICRGHEERRWSRLPPSPNTHCPDKHLHLTISTLTVASSQEPSWRKVSHENMCPIVQSSPVSKQVCPPAKYFSQEPGPAAKAAVMSATGLQEL